MPAGAADEGRKPDDISGYIRKLPPESRADREGRHREVAARRAGTIVMVHRGASDYAPENTLEAFAAAMDHGADGCEIDIRRSRDGVLYLHHDDEGGRVFKGAGPVNRLTYFELLQWPSVHTEGAAKKDTRIPTLAAVLELARQRTMLLHLDIKEPGLDADIAALLDASDTWDHVVHVNAYNSDKLRADSRLKLLQYKGWDHEAGGTEAAQKAFLARPAPMVFAGGSPAKALELIGRTPNGKPVPLPDSLRVSWTKDGPVTDTVTRTAAEAAGWRPLFNGKNLDGWTARGSAKWRVEDGVIAGGQDGDPKRSGLLMTNDQFKDFEIELEFIIDEHGKYNSGVYLRNDPGSGGRTGYQINIGRGAAEEYCAGLFTDRWLDKGDENDSIRKKLDWNSLRILARGAHLEATLNGVKVVDFTDPNPPAKSLQRGVVAFQTYGAEGHAGWVKFRNVRIRAIE
jgi:Domain of Unknown Function (DUF1080)/Glycerophosphoryl diester phosphodiesterase family